MPAALANTINAVPLLRSGKDRRRHKRVTIEIEGRFLNDDGEDHVLRTQDLSCSGALVEAERRPHEGSDVVCYFSELGRVATTVIRHTPDGFAIRFKASQHKKDKLADRLTWLLNREVLALQEDRQAPRYVTEGAALVERADGRQVQCRVVDISLSGASFEADGPPPFVGENIRAGNLVGEVVRRSGNMFAIRFKRNLNDPVEA